MVFGVVCLWDRLDSCKHRYCCNCCLKLGMAVVRPVGIYSQSSLIKGAQPSANTNAHTKSIRVNYLKYRQTQSVIMKRFIC